MKTSKLLIILIALVTVLTMGVNLAQAGDYPSRPITLICPWGAGGGTDAVARFIAILLQQELGVRVNVINRTGGGGVVGHTAMATAKPDGYTIGLATTSITMSHWAGLTELTFRDTVPVALVNTAYAAINVKADSPWKTYRDLEKDVKSQHGKLKGSGDGFGGIWHLSTCGWLKSIGLPIDQVRWVPSKGSAPAQQDMLAGGVEIVTCELAESFTLSEAGKVRQLATMAPEREPKYPDVPALMEMGIDWSFGGFRSIMAPKGTSPEIVGVLEKALKKVINGSEYSEMMAKRGFGVAWMGTEEFQKKIAEWDKINGELMKAVGVAK